MQKPLSYEEMHLRNSEDNSTDVPHTSAKIDTDGDCSSTRGFPDVPIDSKSKKETSQKSLIFISQDVDTDLSGNVRKQMDGWV